MESKEVRIKAAIERQNKIANTKTELDKAKIILNTSTTYITQCESDLDTAIKNAKTISKSGTLKQIIDSQNNIHQKRINLSNAKLKETQDKANVKRILDNLNASIADDNEKKILSDKIDLQNQNIGLQDKALEGLASNITSYQTLLNVVEGFSDNITLSTNNNKELNIYVDSYNNAISLLDDPNQMNKVAFDTYIHIQDNKLKELDANIEILKKNIKSKVILPIKGIRSMNNSSIINVQDYSRPAPTTANNRYINSSNTNPNYPYYLLYGNNGCLQYEPTNKNISASWNFKPCNSNEPKQQFKINKINNIEQYNKPITNSSNKNFKINSDSTVNYGFYSVNPSNSFDQCLQLNNDGISVMPCSMNTSQRFTTNYHSVLE